MGKDRLGARFTDQVSDSCGRNKNPPPLKVWFHLSCAVMLVHWCCSYITESEVKSNGSAPSVLMTPRASIPKIIFAKSLILCCIPWPCCCTVGSDWPCTRTQVHKSRATTRRKHNRERERGATSVVLCSAAEGDGPWIILKTLYYLFKKPWS